MPGLSEPADGARLLVLFSMEDEDEQRAVMLCALSDVLRAHLSYAATLVDAHTWARDCFDRMWQWETWVEESVSGRAYYDRTPYFCGFVLPHREVGRASAAVVAGALQVGKPVLLWEQPRTLCAVRGVRPVPRTWGERWFVQTSGAESQE